MFLGRNKELKYLKKRLLDATQKHVNLVVCYGRRRIGKSELIREFGKNYPTYVEVQGLVPAAGMTNQDQIDNLMQEVSRQLKLPKVSVNNWRDAFRYLSKEIGSKKTLLFLDEISWMGGNDPKFAGVLKQTFDTEFQNNKKLVIVLCGSVSSWISDNILNSTDFLGRINIDINLKELPLNEAKLFFDKSTPLDEVLLFLEHTGGVPRYLKEYSKSTPVGSILSQLSFSPNGLLFNEFERIFNDIFNKRAGTYANIVRALSDGPKTLSEIFSELDTSSGGKYSDYMEDLILSGFVKVSENWNFKTHKQSKKLSKYRISDNYLRFYLKQIEPRKKKIKSNLVHLKSVTEIKGYESFLGYQFENLIYNNVETLIELLQISENEIINFGPYYQPKNSKQDGCQIDFLVQTKSLFYIVEIKSSKKILIEMVRQVESKVKALKIPPRSGVKKILIHASQEPFSDEVEAYFDRIISINDFLS